MTAPRPDKTPDPASDSEKKNGPKGDKEPEVAVTVTGVVKQAADGQGRPSFTLTAGTTTWELSDGPPWYWGDKNPLAAYVGKSVTVAGEAEQGGTELDVDTVDGKAIRAPGKPPWAGGPWAVGPTHPGWKSWMANGKPGKGHDRTGRRPRPRRGADQRDARRPRVRLRRSPSTRMTTQSTNPLPDAALVAAACHARPSCSPCPRRDRRPGLTDGAIHAPEPGRTVS